MPAVDRSILVNAPVESVFEYVADWRHTTKYQRQFSKFEAIGEPSYGLGLTVDARGKFKGLPIRATLRVIEFVKNERIVSKSVAHLKSRSEWRFSQNGSGTKVRFIAHYDWPIPVLTRGLRHMVETEITTMAEHSLRELKRQVEAQGAT